MRNTPENTSPLTLFFGTHESGLLSEARKEAEGGSEELKIGGGVNVVKMGLDPRKSCHDRSRAEGPVPPLAAGKQPQVTSLSSH